MTLKQAFLECIPEAYYENGTEAKCIWYRIFNMFDIDSQSFKEVKDKKVMEDNSKESDYRSIDRCLTEKEKRGGETKVTFGKINHYVSNNTEEN